MRLRPASVVWLGCTVGITAIFGRLVAHNLANYGPVSNDEVELMAVSYKLATQGVLGSDMYVGFFGADQHHLVTLPLQHVLEAIAFRVSGPGTGQMRWVSLLAAVSIVWLAGRLAWRWYGLACAVMCEVLLVAWPSNLTAASNGLPLLGVARTARYDVLAVAFAWAALAVVTALPRRPRPWLALLVGVASGLATLSQFFGVFVVVLVGIALVSSGARARMMGWTIAGLLLVVLPWAIYCGVYAADLEGQLAVYGQRGDFLNPRFYLDNLLNEPSRFRHLVVPETASFGSWLLVVGIGPAAVYVGWRARHHWGDRLLIASLLTFGGLLLALDQTKAPLYAILLLPSICLVFAAGFSGMLSWTWNQRRAWVRASMALPLIVVAVVTVDGAQAYQVDFDMANQVHPYLGVGTLIDDALAPSATVLGPERYWWALHEHPYISLRSIWFQWTAAASVPGGQTPQFADWVHQSGADSVLVNINARNDIDAFPEQLQTQFWSFLDRCTTLVADLPDPNYFESEVYLVSQPRPADC